MEKPSDKKGRSEETPPGGRAFQRIQQDRIARGLDKLPVPGTSRTAADKLQPASEKRRKK